MINNYKCLFSTRELRENQEKNTECLQRPNIIIVKIYNTIPAI